MKLRPYQELAIEKSRAEIKAGAKRMILCSPTGSGKTVMFSFLVRSASSKGKRVLILTHRIELLTQAGGALERVGLDPMKIEAKNRNIDLSTNLHTAMIETITRRMSKQEYIDYVSDLDLIIIDECHMGNFDKFFEHISPKTIVLGFTATPHREGGQKSLIDFYQKIVEVTTISELVNDGFLSKPRSYGVRIDLKGVKKRAGDYDSEELAKKYSDNKVWMGVVDNYNRITPRSKAIAFCPNIKSSIDLCHSLRNAGLNSRYLHGDTDPTERGYLLNWFKHTPDAILCNVGVLTTGFDEPTIDTVILYRATKSLPLFLQMVGRGSRVTESKKEFTILDFGNNILEHGFWQDDRVWTLEKKPKKTDKAGAFPVRECPGCGALIQATKKDCEYCGHVFIEKSKFKSKEVAVVEEIESKSDRLNRVIKMSVDDIYEAIQMKIVNPNAVLHRMTNQAMAYELITKLGYKRGWFLKRGQQYDVFRGSVHRR
jgi:superfamily II DNA or RNA helicase